jgi:hypothetical protein
MDYSKIYEASMYDSRKETQKHIDTVIKNTEKFIGRLTKQVAKHDASKLKDPEKPYFDEATPNLKNLEYGSKEYNKALEDLKPALDHHYANNSHHIYDHYEDGTKDANLLDLIEMLADWVAAVKRNKDGDILKSLEINKKKYNISEDVYALLKNSINLFD